MSQDVVADGLNMIKNAKKAGKEELEISRYSKLLIKVLEIAKKYGYIKEIFVDKEGRKLKVKIGNLNDCNAIKPRFYVKVDEVEKYLRRYLPARDFGIVIISTSKGLITHKEVPEKNLGGSLIAYFY